MDEIKNFKEIAEKQFKPAFKSLHFFGLMIFQPKHLNVVLHDTKVLKDGYLILGEVFYPTTRGTEGYIETYFGGYFYSMAFVIKLDINGKMLWNNSFPLTANERPFMNNSVNISYAPPLAPELLLVNEKEGKPNITLANLSTCNFMCSELMANGELSTQTITPLGAKPLNDLKIQVKNSGLFLWDRDVYFAFNYVVPTSKPKRGEKQNNWVVLTKLKVK